MPQLYIVCYDICDNKRRRKVHKLIADHAIGGQYSCFECYLNQDKKQKLNLKLQACIDESEDSILIIAVNKQVKSYILGCAIKPLNTTLLIVD